MGHNRELPGSLPGPSRWKKRPGRIMVMVMHIAPACSSACTPGAHLCICRPIGGHLSSSSAPRLSSAAPAAAPAASPSGALLRRCPLSPGPLVARVGDLHASVRCSAADAPSTCQTSDGAAWYQAPGTGHPAVCLLHPFKIPVTPRSIPTKFTWHMGSLGGGKNIACDML